MKTFLFIFVFALSLKAETSYQAKCVNSFYLTSTGTTYRINLVYSSTPTVTNVFTYSSAILTELQSGIDLYSYSSSTGQCIAKMDNKYNYFLSSLVGILIGFTILFFAIFLTIKVGSKK